jgi:hypothetical protein
MPHGGNDHIVLAQVLSDGLRLCGRLDHDQVSCQSNVLSVQAPLLGRAAL